MLSCRLGHLIFGRLFQWLPLFNQNLLFLDFQKIRWSLTKYFYLAFCVTGLRSLVTLTLKGLIFLLFLFKCIFCMFIKSFSKFLLTLHFQLISALLLNLIRWNFLILGCNPWRSLMHSLSLIKLYFYYVRFIFSFYYISTFSSSGSPLHLFKYRYLIKESKFQIRKCFQKNKISIYLWINQSCLQIVN